MLCHSRQKVTARGAYVTELTPRANIFIYEWELNYTTIIIVAIERSEKKILIFIKEAA